MVAWGRGRSDYKDSISEFFRGEGTILNTDSGDVFKRLVSENNYGLEYKLLTFSKKVILTDNFIVSSLSKGSILSHTVATQIIPPKMRLKGKEVFEFSISGSRISIALKVLTNNTHL